AADKLHANFSALLDQAEKAETPKDSGDRNRAESLSHDADRWFKGTKYHDTDMARAKKLYDKWTGAVGGASAVKADALKKLTDKANADWPGILKGISCKEDFKPAKWTSFKGDAVHIKRNNRLGWDYSPGPYDFAAEIDGVPFAAEFDPTVKAAVADA